ncbi:MAG: cytochrome c oxidase subunit 3 [Methylococcales bacterium]
MSQGQSKSWQPAVGIPNDSKPTALFALAKPNVGLGVILVVLGMLFFLLFITYASRMQLGDWHPLPEPRILWLNTVLLVFSSCAFRWAKLAWSRSAIHTVYKTLLAAGILAFLFLAGQLLAWQQIRSSGYLLEGNPATSFFYLITLVHGLHVAAGLVAWFRTWVRFVRGNSVLGIRIGIELCALYWHFLLVVWLIFYGLMLST